MWINKFASPTGCFVSVGANDGSVTGQSYCQTDPNKLLPKGWNNSNCVDSYWDASGGVAASGTDPSSANDRCNTASKVPTYQLCANSNSECAAPYTMAASFAGQGPAGAQGPMGLQGSPGAQGDPGTMPIYAWIILGVAVFFSIGAVTYVVTRK